jgi:CBS domain containing-hemolysin-like protein
MRDTGVRHLPVVAGDDVVGMISMRDVLDVVRREQTAHRGRLTFDLGFRPGASRIRRTQSPPTLIAGSA